MARGIPSMAGHAVFSMVITSCLLVCSRSVYASDLEFTSQPQALSSGLDSLRLRCSLIEDNSLVSDSQTIIGRRETWHGADDSTSGQPLDNDPDLGYVMTHGEDRKRRNPLFAHITAIVMSKLDQNKQTNVTIASVTQTDVPTVFVNASVQGQLKMSSSSGGSVAYLDVEWKFPSEDEKGVYFCQALGFTEQFQQVSLLRQVNVSSDVSLLMNADKIHQDLLQIVSTNQQQIAELIARLSDYDTKLQTLTKELKDTESLVQELKHNASDRDHQLSQYKQTLQNIQDSAANLSQAHNVQLNQSKFHVEEGIIHCLKDTSSYVVKFSTPYEKPPHIHFGIQSLHLKIAVEGGAFYGSNLQIKNNDISLSILDKSETGFHVRCNSSPDDTARHSWISVGQ